jgi:hypothetical protein
MDPHAPGDLRTDRPASAAQPLPTPEEARRLAEQLLAELPRRLRHTLAVGGTAGRIVERAGLRGRTRDDALAAAYLHDVGYAEPLRRTGFHPLDGAHYLRGRGWELLARVVARHSQAHLQARALGLSLASFPPRRGVVQDVVDYADARTGPDGQLFTPEERLREILARHGPDSVQGRVMARRAPYVRALVRRIEARCGGDPLR